MTSLDPVQLVGGTGSPYTQKMVALLRYRRIPYSITWGQPETTCEALGVEAPKPTFMPTFFFEEGGELTAHCDSTPIIRRLEADHAGRSVLPEDPALAFIDYLIEDFSDEWCTKYMFHYRWHFATDADNAGTKLPLSMDVSMPQSQFQQFKDFISQRQIERLWVVGSNEETAPIIDASYRRFLAAMEAPEIPEQAADHATVEQEVPKPLMTVEERRVDEAKLMIDLHNGEPRAPSCVPPAWL